MGSRALLVALLAAIGMALAGLGPPAQPAADPANLIDRAEAYFNERHELETLTRMIDLYERALSDVNALPPQRQRAALDRMAQLYYERSALRPGTDVDDRDDWTRSKELGFRRLRMNEGFAERENRDFPEALAHIENPAPLLWTANAWGQIFQRRPLEGLANVGKVLAMYERCTAVAASFWGGNCVHALGALLVTTPGALGGNRERGRDLQNRAVEIDPGYLTNRTVRAQYLGFTYDALGNANGIRDRALIERELRVVEEAPIGDWPFWNRIAKRRVDEIREDLERFASE